MGGESISVQLANHQVKEALSGGRQKKGEGYGWLLGRSGEEFGLGE